MKSKSQKAKDLAFIKKCHSIGVITGSALSKLAKAQGVPEKVEVDGEVYTLKSATPVVVEAKCTCVKKHDGSGEQEFAA